MGIQDHVKKCHGCDHRILPFLHEIVMRVRDTDPNAPACRVTFYFHRSCAQAYAQGQMDAGRYADPELVE